MKSVVSILFGIMFWPVVAVGQELYPAEPLGQGRLLFEKQNAAIVLEVATTEGARARGLMFRNELADGHGMLFVYPADKVLGVWMKNTRIPLDILFISAPGRIVSMLQNVQPCVTPACGVYNSVFKARYMLEVNAGTIDRLGIAVGDKVRLAWR